MPSKGCVTQRLCVKVAETTDPEYQGGKTEETDKILYLSEFPSSGFLAFVCKKKELNFILNY